MRKADLLDELRSDIGVVSDRCRGDLKVLYQFVCDRMMEVMRGYRWAAIYMKERTSFVCRFERGERLLPYRIPFGEGNISLAAVRGGIVWERTRNRVEVYVPFYRGHYLKGILVIMAPTDSGIDDEDVSLFCEVAALFESKIKEHNS